MYKNPLSVAVRWKHTLMMCAWVPIPGMITMSSAKSSSRYVYSIN